jgi:hypothetical protein
MSDAFEMHVPALNSPATRHAAITPSDSADLPNIPRALYILTDGDLAVRSAEGVDIIYPVFAGQIFPFRGVRILDTGTDATAVAWW